MATAKSGTPLRAFTYSTIDLKAFHAWKALDNIPSSIGSFSGVLRDLSDCESNPRLRSLLIELVHAVVEGHIIPRQLIFYLRSFSFHVNTAAQQTLADVIWYVEAECSAVRQANPTLFDNLAGLVKFIADTIDESIIDCRILFETLDLDFLDYCELCPSEVPLKARLRKQVTSIHYKQQKFCLVTEESEGYAKLIVMLHEFGCECLNNKDFDDLYYDSFMDNIVSLIGVFDLDANRVVDLVLDCILCSLSSLLKRNQTISEPLCEYWKPFIYILSRFNSSHIPHIFGMKVQSQSSTVLNQAYLMLSVLLVESDIVPVAWLLGYLVSPSKSSLSQDSSVVVLRSVMSEIVNLIGQKEQTTGQAIKSAGMTSLTQEVKAIKSLSSLSSQSIADLSVHARNIMSLLSTYLMYCGVSRNFKITCETLSLHCNCRGFDEIFVSLMSLNELSLGLYAHANNFLTSRMMRYEPACVFTDYAEVIDDGISCLSYLLTCLSSSRWLIGLNGLLFARLTKLIEFYLIIMRDESRYRSEMAWGAGNWSLASLLSSSSSNDGHNYWIGNDATSPLTGQLSVLERHCRDITSQCLLPSLASCGDGNFTANINLWNVLKHFHFSIRYSWYSTLLHTGLGKSGFTEVFEKQSKNSVDGLIQKKPSQCYLMEAEALNTLKSHMKRLSGENVKLQGRNMAKVACRCPLIASSYISYQIENYDNLIEIIVDSVQYASALSRDVMLFWMLNSLRKEEGEKISVGKGRMKADGMNFAQWIVSIAKFIGLLFYRYNDDNADISAVLYLLMERLVGATDGLGSECVDLVILRDLIGYAGGGVWSIIQVDDEKIPALSGGPLLRQHSIIQKQPWTAACANKSLSTAFVAIDGILDSSGGKDSLKSYDLGSVSTKSSKACCEKLRQALYDRQIGIRFINVICSLKDRSIFDTDSTQLKFISSLHDLCQDVILQLISFMSDNYCHNSSVSIGDCVVTDDFQLPDELTQLWGLLGSFSSLLDNIKLPIMTAMVVSRPLMRAALVSHYNFHLNIAQSESKSKRAQAPTNMKLAEMLKSDLSQMQSNGSMVVDGELKYSLRQLWLNWHPLSPRVVSPVNDWMISSETSRPVTMLPLDAKGMIRNSLILKIPEFFSLSQSLSLFDLEFPKTVYEDDVSRLVAAYDQLDKRKKTVSSQLDDSHISSDMLDLASGILGQVKKEINRLKPASEDLKAEMTHHSSHVNIVQNIISCLRNDLLPAECDDNMIMVGYALNHWCWLPRCTFSPEEARFVAIFSLQTCHDAEVRPISTFYSYCRLVSLSATLLSSTTEGEARNIGFMVRELLRFGNRWFTSQNIYTREFESKKGSFVNRFNDSQRVTYTSFCEGHKSAEVNLVRAISACVQNKEYMNRKSGLSVLRKSMQFFPKYARMCNYMMKFLKNLVESMSKDNHVDAEEEGDDGEVKGGGGEDQDDILLIAQQLLLALEEKLPSLIEDVSVDGRNKTRSTTTTTISTAMVAKQSSDSNSSKRKKDDESSNNDDVRKKPRIQSEESNRRNADDVDSRSRAPESFSRKWQKVAAAEDTEEVKDAEGGKNDDDAAIEPVVSRGKATKPVPPTIAMEPKTASSTSNAEPSSAGGRGWASRRAAVVKPESMNEEGNKRTVTMTTSQGDASKAKSPPIPPEPVAPQPKRDDNDNDDDGANREDKRRNRSDWNAPARRSERSREQESDDANYDDRRRRDYHRQESGYRKK